jgi:PhoPQ-activated pathogenicity-related protein
MPIEGKGRDGVTWTGHVLNMTSQQWLTPEDVDRSIWFHYLVVIIPSNLNTDAFKYNASLYVTGGSNTGAIPSSPTDEDLLVAATLAMNTGTIAGTLFQVPNEHMVFTSDPIQQSRTEDAIIAFTWDHFLKYPDQPEWLVRLPMVKSVLRAMDAMTEFCGSTGEHADLGVSLDYYTVAGASKRGWTTWLMGAVDPARVVAAVPIVLDAVNFVKFAHTQYQAYNGWTFALEDYYQMNITDRFDDPNMVKLQEIVDPYWYFDRLTMPKLVVNAVGDEFQMPDDTHHWWSDLPEPKHFLMVPNAEHSLATGILEAVPAICAWISTLLNKQTVPTMDWDRDDESGQITLTLGEGADQVDKVMKYWTETGETYGRRDFRFLNVDDPCLSGVGADGNCLNTQVFWKAEEVTASESDPNVYVGTHPMPANGTWAAFFLDVTYKKSENQGVASWPGGFIPTNSFVHEFTTEVSIIPDTLPFDDCSGTDCHGVLV